MSEKPKQPSTPNMLTYDWSVLTLPQQAILFIRALYKMHIKVFFRHYLPRRSRAHWVGNELPTKPRVKIVKLSEE